MNQKLFRHCEERSGAAISSNLTRNDLNQIPTIIFRYMFYTQYTTNRSSLITIYLGCTF
jgi:hypothetical protein